MADTLEVRKLKLEKARVSLAKMEMEIRIDSLQEEIKRNQDNIAVQEKRELELDAKITELQTK